MRNDNWQKVQQSSGYVTWKSFVSKHLLTKSLPDSQMKFLRCPLFHTQQPFILPPWTIVNKVLSGWCLLKKSHGAGVVNSMYVLPKQFLSKTLKLYCSLNSHFKTLKTSCFRLMTRVTKTIEFPCTFYPASPNNSILYNHSKLSKLGNWQRHNIN